jgi:hypothetical protein
MMSKEQIIVVIQAQLLNFQCSMLGMEAENQLTASRGEAPEFVQDDFEFLRKTALDGIEDLLKELRGSSR